MHILELSMLHVAETVTKNGHLDNIVVFVPELRFFLFLVLAMVLPHSRSVVCHTSAPSEAS